MRYIIFHKLLYLGFIAIIAFTAFSCGSPANEHVVDEVAVVEAEEAFEDLRLFVKDQDATYVMGREDMDAIEYERLMAARAAEYERLVRQAERAIGPEDQVRHQQLAELRSRYDTVQAVNTRAYLALQRERELRQDLLGPTTKKGEIETMEAPELASRYQMFSTRIAENQAEYTAPDWETVERIWAALESRRQELEPGINRPYRGQIEQARTRFENIRAEMPHDVLTGETPRFEPQHPPVIHD
jgi:hypothetical protein